MNLIHGILQQQVNLSGTTLKDGLLSVWELDETSGTTAYDSYGSNNGTIVHAILNQSGLIDKCYYFDGVSDYVTFGDVLNIGTRDYTISSWIKLAGIQKDSYAGNTIAHIAGKGILGTNNGCGIYLYNEVFRGQLRDRYTALSVESTTNLNDGLWHHVVATVDRDSSTGFNVYIDNVLENTEDPTALSSDDLVTSDAFSLGARNSGTSWNYDFFGNMDQVAVWNKALTSDEVDLLYNSGNGLAYSNW